MKLQSAHIKNYKGISEAQINVDGKRERGKFRQK
jgi:hypothetical protein